MLMRDRMNLAILLLTASLAGCGDLPHNSSDTTLANPLMLSLLLLISPFVPNSPPPEPMNYSKLFQSDRELAGRGDVSAQTRLGNMYEMGQGVSQDYAEAIKWHRKAANQGDFFAQYDIGNMYEIGRGVPQDNVQACMWFSLAATRGHRLSASRRDTIEKKMTPAQIAGAKKLTSEWRPVGAGATGPPAASTTPTAGVSQPVTSPPPPSGPASSHPRIGLV